MDYQIQYQNWLTSSDFDDETKAELRAISGDEQEIKDRFYQPLAFGTAGMRGIMGAGTNRMNRYSIQRATAGLAAYLLDKYQRGALTRGVVIAYDSRHHSAEFAEETALVLGAYGINAYVFDVLTPTPELSFAVRYLKAVGGVVITASHNAKVYNGYKVYDDCGCQLVPELAQELMSYMDKFDDLEALPLVPDRARAEAEGVWHQVGQEVHEAFVQAVLAQALPVDAAAKAQLSVVYTPLHGSGRVPVQAVLAADGFTSVQVLAEQAEPDGDFPTVHSPNPEEKDALQLAIDYGQRVGADLVLGTDPDCDRVGIAVRHEGAYQLFSGNEVGALLVDFLGSQRQGALNDKSTLVTTIVTSDLGADIARHYGMQVVQTLTGFKFIGQQMAEFLRTGAHEFVMGYEESYGYLVGQHARDKDAVVASLVICEMAAYYKQQGRSLVDVLQSLYGQYGYHLDVQDSFTLAGADGQVKIAAIMTMLRNNPPQMLTGEAVTSVQDYLDGDKTGLPPADVLKYALTQGGWLAVRPSGTEPKIKFYYAMVGADRAQAQAQLALMQAEIRTMMQRF